MEIREYILTEEDLTKYGTPDEGNTMRKNKTFTDFEEFKAYISRKYSSKIVDYYTDEKTHDIILVLDNGLRIRTMGKVGLPKGESEYHIYRQKNRKINKELENVENKQEVIKEDFDNNNLTFSTKLKGDRVEFYDEYEYNDGNEDEDEDHEISTVVIKWGLEFEYKSWGVKDIIPNILNIVVYYNSGLNEILENYKIEISYKDKVGFDYISSIFPCNIEIDKIKREIIVYF